MPVLVIVIKLWVNNNLSRTDSWPLARVSVKINQGWINCKKRFGKSLANKAPAMFLTILDNKLKLLGTELHRINTIEVKASQYNHVENSYVKKELKKRWTMIGEAKIQRDLYSSFLIMNINPDLRSINRVQCLETFEKFKIVHDIEIERLKASTNCRGELQKVVIARESFCRVKTMKPIR